MSTRESQRDALLAAARAAVLSKGFPAMRVDEICRDAGVTKGCFYHHFASKDDLARLLADHHFEELVRQLTLGEWGEVVDPVDRLQAFLTHAEDVVQGDLLRDGCILGSFALDLSETHPELRCEIESKFEALVSTLRPMISGAMESRGAAGDAGQLARQFVSVLQGAIVLAKAYADHEKVREGVRCYGVMLEAVLGIQGVGA